MEEIKRDIRDNKQREWEERECEILKYRREE